MEQTTNPKPVWIPQIKVNPDGLASYLACTVNGIHTNEALSREIKFIAKKSDSLFRVADVSRGGCTILYAKHTFDDAVKVLNNSIMEYSKQNCVIIHSQKSFF